MTITRNPGTGCISIPPAALEAAAIAQYAAECAPTTIEHATRYWRVMRLDHQQTRLEEARAAALALLENWPGMEHYNPHAEPYYGKHLILPLTEAAQPRIPTETDNDKA